MAHRFVHFFGILLPLTLALALIPSPSYAKLPRPRLSIRSVCGVVLITGVLLAEYVNEGKEREADSKSAVRVLDEPFFRDSTPQTIRKKLRVLGTNMRRNFLGQNPVSTDQAAQARSPYVDEHMNPHNLFLMLKEYARRSRTIAHRALSLGVPLDNEEKFYTYVGVTSPKRGSFVLLSNALPWVSIHRQQLDLFLQGIMEEVVAEMNADPGAPLSARWQPYQQLKYTLDSASDYAERIEKLPKGDFNLPLAEIDDHLFRIQVTGNYLLHHMLQNNDPRLERILANHPKTLRRLFQIRDSKPLPPDSVAQAHQILRSSVFTYFTSGSIYCDFSKDIADDFLNFCAEQKIPSSQSIGNAVEAYLRALPWK